MTAIAGMQSICGSPVTTRAYGSKQFLVPSSYTLPLNRSTVLKVRSMAQEGEKKPIAAEAKTTIPPTMPTPPPKPKVNKSFFDLLAFSGPAPERINGRLAMIGFVAALVAESSSGQDLFAQLQKGGVPWFLGTSVLLSLASLIPLFKGDTVESWSSGLMTSDAEMWNGRIAMLGLVALAVTEYVTGSALV